MSDHPCVTHVVPKAFGKNGTVGGAERYVQELARHMAEVVPTQLVTFGEEERREQLGKLAIHVIGNAHYVRGQSWNPVAGTPLLKAVLGADIVHCHQQHIVASSLAAATCRLTGRKVFVTELGGGGWDISAYVSTDRWYHGHLHISEYSREVFGQTQRPWAHVILGGVDTEKFSPDPSLRRTPKVIFVGRMMPHKGIDYLIQAMPPDLELEVIGQPYDRRYADDLKKLASGKRITFLDNCDDATLVQKYRTAMCIVLPSVYRTMYGEETKVPELLGQTLLEGMACGAAAICTNVASMPEIVQDGVTGFIVSPNNPMAIQEKLLWLRDHLDDAERMGQAGRARVLSHFTWPEVVRRCLQIYNVA